MTDEQILKAFEGRWRIKGNFGQINSNVATMSFDEFYDYIKSLCRDFFTAGILIAEQAHTPRALPSGSPDGTPATVSDASASADSEMWNQESSFEYWWTLYDKKRGREKCLQKWQRLTESDRTACINATPAYVASTPDKQFRKDPLTYLNQKAWNDEIINRNAVTQPTLHQQRIDKLAGILAD